MYAMAPANALVQHSACTKDGSGEFYRQRRCYFGMGQFGMKADGGGG
jgi:hypothetical protein